MRFQMTDGNWNVRIVVFGALAALTFVAFGSGYYLDELRNPHTTGSNRLIVADAPTDTGNPDKNQAYHQAEVLRAQQEAAKWTRRMGQAAIIGLFLSVVGMFLIWRTWYAAREANKISERIGMAQTRAYVTIDSLKAKKVDGGLQFVVVVKNSGQSPALAAQAKLSILSKDDENYVVFPKTEQQIPAQSVVAMPYCYVKSAQAHSWESIVVTVQLGFADVFHALTKTEEAFAGVPHEWTFEETTELKSGKHVANYIDSMGVTPVGDSGLFEVDPEAFDDTHL